MLFIVTFIGFAESLPEKKRRSLAPGPLAASYVTVLSDKRFIGFTLVYSFGFACMFSYISGSASMLMGELKLSETAFSLIFAVTSCGILFGSLLSSRLSRKQVPSHRIINSGLAAMGSSAGLLFALVYAGIVSAFIIAPLVAIVIFCFGLITPSANHEALHKLGHVAGSASGVMRCIQMLFGAIASALVAALEPTGNPALNMAGLMLASLLLAGGAYLFVMRTERASVTAATD
ncbi:MFS transporter [Paenirhodobacter populi]|uniref:MFS transporter n=1 Tax=Paenirhodobacter populi TaxID=2306993 RepID=A0A443J8V3_9RHOB|nr:MFS transporter [Sinirhodobacter populi]RWR16935.1 MFS transporter [Sinirhodobacter populi]